MRTALLFAAIALLGSAFVSACGNSMADAASNDGTADTAGGGDAWWQTYAEAPQSGRWEAQPLDEERYKQVVQEVACLNRDYDGVDEARAMTLSRVYFHHKTTAEAIATYGQRINNGDAAEAQRIGNELMQRIETCKAPATP